MVITDLNAECCAYPNRAMQIKIIKITNSTLYFELLYIEFN